MSSIGYLSLQSSPLREVGVIQWEPRLLVRTGDGVFFMDRAQVHDTKEKARAVLQKELEDKLRYQEAELVKTQQLLAQLKEL